MGLYFQRRLLPLILFNCLVLALAGNSPEISYVSHPVTCHGDSDGGLTITIKQITDPLVLRYYQESTQDTLYKSVPNDTQIEIVNLPGGVIRIDLMRNSELIWTANVLVAEPESLQGKIILVKAPPSATDCTGQLRIEVMGGNPPYRYQWSENLNSATDAEVNSICYGIYRCRVEDSKGCEPVHISIPLFATTIKDYTRESEL